MPEEAIVKEEFELKLTGNGVNIEMKISKKAALQVIAAVMGGTGTASLNLNDPLSTPSEASSPTGLSIREFLDEVNATRKTDQIVAIGYYLCHGNEQTDFSKDDVKNSFAEAMEPMPANFSRDFASAAKGGHIAQTHQKPGRFYITKTGVQAVKRHFEKIGGK